MNKKVVSIKEVKYTKQYKDFFSDSTNVEISRKVFFKGDTITNNAVKIKIS